MHLKNCKPAIAWGGGGCGPQKLKQTTVIKEIRWISLFHLRLLRCPFSGEKTTFCYFQQKASTPKGWDGPLSYTLMHLKNCKPAIAFPLLASCSAKRRLQENGTRCISQNLDASSGSRLELMDENLGTHLLQVVLRCSNSRPSPPPSNPIDVFREMVKVRCSRTTQAPLGWHHEDVVEKVSQAWRGYCFHCLR